MKLQRANALQFQSSHRSLLDSRRLVYGCLERTCAITF